MDNKCMCELPPHLVAELETLVGHAQAKHGEFNGLYHEPVSQRTQAKASAIGRKIVTEAEREGLVSAGLWKLVPASDVESRSMSINPCFVVPDTVGKAPLKNIEVALSQDDGQAESLRRHQDAIAALRRAIRLAIENGDRTILVDSLDQITNFDDPYSLPEPECVMVRIAADGSFVTEVYMGDGTKKPVPIDWTGEVSEDEDYGEAVNAIMGRGAKPTTVIEEQYHSGGQPVTVDRVEAPPVIERRDGCPDYEPKWRSTTIHDMRAIEGQPQYFEGYAETEGGRVEISVQVGLDGVGTGTAVLPSGKEVPMKNIDPDLVALMKQGKASVSIDGISVSDQAHTVDSCAACLVEESGRQECREAHKNTLCPEEQEERSEV